MKTGLVVGKFYPPHRGHKLVIEAALAAVDWLDVLVCVKPEQSISGPLRVQWLQELHPTAHVRAVEDPGKDDDSEFWAKYTLEILGKAPDVVFTSEDYGDAYARHLGCRHVMIDRYRLRVPASARAIRAAPLRNWDYLEPCVRAYFAKRISVVGAESTGKTTLARELAGHYATVWVPEYGREYCLKLRAAGVDLWKYKWGSSEFAEIAQRQQENEDRLARDANRILICDTDVLATGVWHERYFGNSSHEVDAMAAGHPHDLYLLTDCDLPFVQDGLRDGETIREWMTLRLEQVLMNHRLNWMKISGTGRQRLETAVSAIDELLAPTS